MAGHPLQRLPGLRVRGHAWAAGRTGGQAVRRLELRVRDRPDRPALVVRFLVISLRSKEQVSAPRGADRAGGRARATPRPSPLRSAALRPGSGSAGRHTAPGASSGPGLGLVRRARAVRTQSPGPRLPAARGWPASSGPMPALSAAPAFGPGLLPGLLPIPGPCPWARRFTGMPRRPERRRTRTTPGTHRSYRGAPPQWAGRTFTGTSPSMTGRRALSERRGDTYPRTTCRPTRMPRPGTQLGRGPQYRPDAAPGTGPMPRRARARCRGRTPARCRGRSPVRCRGPDTGPMPPPARDRTGPMPRVRAPVRCRGPRDWPDAAGGPAHAAAGHGPAAAAPSTGPMPRSRTPVRCRGADTGPMPRPGTGPVPWTRRAAPGRPCCRAAHRPAARAAGHAGRRPRTRGIATYLGRPEVTSGDEPDQGP